MPMPLYVLLIFGDWLRKFNSNSFLNIETSFKQLRVFAIVFICLCAVITVYSVYSAFDFAEKQRQKIYVLDGGKSLMLALSQDLSQNRPVEARQHVIRFHELLFSLAPEKKRDRE